MIPPPGVCELWVARAAWFAGDQGPLEELLPPAERAQVDRHRREADRRRLRLSRALLRVLLAFAFQQGSPVGVDVEAVAGPDRPPPELVELALTPAERRHLAQAPPPERWRRFLGYWTRKEAALKQLGTGLAIPLHDLEVRPRGHPRRRGRHRRPAPGPADRRAPQVPAVAQPAPLPARRARSSSRRLPARNAAAPMRS